MNYIPASSRYTEMLYRRCGDSGLLLPAISLGLWQNFGYTQPFELVREILLKAFDHGVTHFDLANNYGVPAGSAEENFGKVLNSDLKSHRDELIVSTKAGHSMWPGPYGDWGSKKYLVASLNQSLQRMKLDYVDIFYHHRPDPNTPMEETMHTLDLLVRQGKALYVGISNYPADATQKAADLLKKTGTPFIIHQPRYSMLDRWVEKELLNTLENNKLGCIAFSPLAQGLLTDRYLSGVPADSRVVKANMFLNEEKVKAVLPKIKLLNEIAKKRNQTLAQMSIAWLLKDERVTSVLIGASSVSQLEINLKSLQNLTFREDELQKIEKILTGK